MSWSEVLTVLGLVLIASVVWGFGSELGRDVAKALKELVDWITG